jgi:phosphohistidine phosphatase SixA
MAYAKDANEWENCVFTLAWWQEKMRTILFCTIAMVGLAFVGIGGHAQTNAPAIPAAPAQAGSTTPGWPAPPAQLASPPLPIVDPAKEIKGAALVEALRKGGFVLYMRHAETGIVTDKCDQSNLSPAGEATARNVGAAMRDLKIPFGAVRSSQMCRTWDTARLLGVGEVEKTEDLNPMPPRPDLDIAAMRAKRLAEMPPAGTNTVLVSHLHGSRKKEEWLHLGMGETIVFRPDGNARAEPVARITVADWAVLKKLMAGEAL